MERASAFEAEVAGSSPAAVASSDPKKVFREKVRARADRPELARLMRTLSAGDVVLVTRLDRLARSTCDLLNSLAALAGSRSAPLSAGTASPVSGGFSAVIWISDHSHPAADMEELTFG